MARYVSISVEESLDVAMGELVAGLLETGVVGAVMVPARQPYGNTVRQTVITSPEEAATADPLAPIVPVNAATLLAKLTRKATSTKVAAFLRSCEVRAFLELVKLKQASLDHVLLVGMDCYGRYSNSDYVEHQGADEGSTLEFLTAMSSGEGPATTDGHDIVSACKACELPVADNVDLRLQVFGHDPRDGLLLEAVTEEGTSAFEKLDFPDAAASEIRPRAVEELVSARRDFKEAIRAEYREKVKDIDGLMEVISNCIDCYNCRAACPVCYCRECVFLTDTFSHDSKQYIGWAQKRGRLRMPTDTLFFHLTRMAHMSTLCVGCGQCSTACPNDILVSELFGVVAEGAQAVFDYVPGRDPEEAQPLASFREEELHQITGQLK